MIRCLDADESEKFRRGTDYGITSIGGKLMMGTLTGETPDQTREMRLRMTQRLRRLDAILDERF